LQNDCSFPYSESKFGPMLLSLKSTLKVVIKTILAPYSNSCKSGTT